MSVGRENVFRTHCGVHILIRVFTIPTLEEGTKREADLGGLGRVDGVLFPAFGNLTSPTVTLGQYAYMSVRRRCAGVRLHGAEGQDQGRGAEIHQPSLGILFELRSCAARSTENQREGGGMDLRSRTSTPLLVLPLPVDSISGTAGKPSRIEPEAGN